MTVEVKWLYGQAVKTPPSHGGYTGSNPVRVTMHSQCSPGVRIRGCIFHYMKVIQEEIKW